MIAKWVQRLIRDDPNFRPRECFGQDGEDLILDRMFHGQPNGFFVDIGAHHPVRFSNTYAFYRKGWRGINIDAAPGSMKSFKQHRPGDINLEFGVASRSGYKTYYRFNEPALNTFDEEEAMLKSKAPYHVIDTVQVEVKRLDELLELNLPKGQLIDFFSVDVEGMDEEVLASNDWSKFRPRVVLAETLRVDLLQLASCPVVRFMESVGYTPVSKAYNTTFFTVGT